jgi:hypothetical protein
MAARKPKCIVSETCLIVRVMTVKAGKFVQNLTAYGYLTLFHSSGFKAGQM